MDFQQNQNIPREQAALTPNSSTPSPVTEPSQSFLQKWKAPIFGMVAIGISLGSAFLNSSGSKQARGFGMLYLFFPVVIVNFMFFVEANRSWTDKALPKLVRGTVMGFVLLALLALYTFFLQAA